MIFKNINNLLIISLLLFLYSCSNINNFTYKNNEKITYNNIKEIKYKIDLTQYQKFNFNKQDFYSTNSYNNYISNKNLKQVHKIKIKKNKKDLNESNLKLIINQDSIFSFDSNSNFVAYDLLDLNIIKEINFNDLQINTNSYPVSFSYYDNLFYVGYSDGTIISFNKSGILNWQINYADILKTPLKIHNDQIIVLLSNQILSLNSKNGSLNWQYIYDNENVLQSKGGDIVNINNFLFFILPNNMTGEVDTIFGEKNRSIFSEIHLKNLINNSNDTLHTYKDNLSYFDQNKFLSTINLSDNILLLDSKKIKDVKSAKFINNALITLHSNSYLQANNIVNNKVFFESDLSEYIDDNDKIINLTTTEMSVILFFGSGKIIEINSTNGKIIKFQNLKIKNLNLVYFLNDMIVFTKENAHTYIFKQ